MRSQGLGAAPALGQPRPCASRPLQATGGAARRAGGGATPARAQKLEEARQESAAASTSGNGASLNGAASVSNGARANGAYPKLETGAQDTDILPTRQPGDFPDSKAGVAAAPEFDPLRDGPLRYLGYANEVGEAFAAWLPGWGVPFSYAVAIAYVLTDTADKGSKAYRDSTAELAGRPDLPAAVDVPRLVRLLAAERTLDTVVWQLLASVACPGFTIHQIVALVHAAFRPLQETAQAQQLAAAVAAQLHLQAADVLAVADKSLPTACGLAAIPFIVHPIDNAIHGLMNASLRPAMRRLVCGQGGGQAAGLGMCACDDCGSSAGSSGH